MKINLVNYEILTTSQILSKFAWKMSEELDKLNIPHSLSDAPDPAYDINHHITYSSYKHVDSVNTVMVTHIDTPEKMKKVHAAAKTADKLICLSQSQRESLLAEGIPFEKTAVILPAHNDEIIPIPVAILTNVYEDGRKREFMLEELAKVIDKKRFLFRIMGQHWDIPKLQKLGLNIESHDVFEPQEHRLILQNSKYYLYMGLDEGSMGAIDAKNAGLQLIATPQGFHRELGLDYAFTTQDELNKIFFALQNPMPDGWTWGNYTKHYLLLWEELFKKRNKS